MSSDETTTGREKLYELLRELGIRLDDNSRVLRDVAATLRGLQRDQERAKKKHHGFKRKLNAVGMSMKTGSLRRKSRSVWHSWRLTSSKAKRPPED